MWYNDFVRKIKNYFPTKQQFRTSFLDQVIQFGLHYVFLWELTFQQQNSFPYVPLQDFVKHHSFRYKRVHHWLFHPLLISWTLSFYPRHSVLASRNILRAEFPMTNHWLLQLYLWYERAKFSEMGIYKARS